jgi:putative membrane protein
VSSARRQAEDAVFPAVLLAAFVLWFVALGIAPSFREDWLLENLLVLGAVPTLVWAYSRLRFSNGVYLALFVFFCLHEVGAHYTYSLVPYREWIPALAGTERNHYDRLVHFAYGLLVTPALFEVFRAYSPGRAAWRWLLPATAMFGHSVIYELVEWAAAEIFGGDLGVAYLGTQGDPWDAQKDMTLAALGTVLSLCGIGRLECFTRYRARRSAFPRSSRLSR